jgi:tetratricopeptide (TPR) repeat protein
MYSTGITVKGIRQNIDTYNGSTAACDLGVLVRGWMPELNLGATLRNVGAPMKFKEQGYALPLAMDLGGAYRFWKKSFLWTLDLSMPYQSELSVKTGCEYNFEDMLFLRAGYRYSASLTSLGALAGITAGIGFTISDYTLDYAYTPYGALGDVHRIALTFPFGRSSVDEEKIIQRMENNIRLRQENMIRECMKAGTRALEKNEFAEANTNFEKIRGLNSEYPGLKALLERASQGLAKQKADARFSAGMKAFKGGEFLVALVEWTKVNEMYPAYPDLKKWMDAANQKLVQPEHPAGWTSQNETGRMAAKMDAVVARGLELLKAGQYTRALDAWQEGLKADPGNATLKSLMQKAHLQMQSEINSMLQDAREAWQAEKWVDAVRLWRRILRIDANQVQALQQLEVNQMKIRLVANDLYVKGVNNYVQNRWNEAIQNWKDLLVLDPDNQKARKNMESIERKIEDMQTL